jgi:hypothetical protein
MSGFENAIRKKRTRAFTVTLFESDGSTAVIIAAADRVRFKIYRGDDEDPYLDILSGVAAPGGSTVTPTPGTNSVAIVIRQGDVERLAPGAYDAEILLVDQSDTNAAKHAETGVIHILESGGGNIGLDADDSSQSSSSSSSPST